MCSHLQVTGCTSLLVSEERVGEDETNAEVVDSSCFSSAQFTFGSEIVDSTIIASDVLRHAIALAGS